MYSLGTQRGGRRAAIALLLSVAVALCLITLSLNLRARRPNAASSAEDTRRFNRFVSPDLPLDRGLALVLFLGMDCSHCIETAKQIGTFDAAAHGLRVYLVLLGKPEEVEPFFQTIGTALPYCLATPQDYAEFAGEDPPTLYLLDDGRIRAQWPGSRFNLDVLSDELRRKR